jgi:glutaconate CoA-transferase subunit B
MPGAGPTRVVTDKAILESDPTEGELMLSALYPGVNKEDVIGSVGWQLRSRSNLTCVDPPTERELYLLREVLDPQRLYLKQ